MNTAALRNSEFGGITCIEIMQAIIENKIGKVRELILENSEFIGDPKYISTTKVILSTAKRCNNNEIIISYLVNFRCQ